MGTPPRKDLNADVLVEIFSHLCPIAAANRTKESENEHRVRLRTLAMISASNRAFHQLVIPFLYRTLDVRKHSGGRHDIRPITRMRKFLDHLIQQPQLGKYVRKIFLRSALLTHHFNSRQKPEFYLPKAIIRKYSSAMQRNGFPQCQELEDLHPNFAQFPLLFALCPRLKYLGFNFCGSGHLRAMLSYLEPLYKSLWLHVSTAHTKSEHIGFQGSLQTVIVEHEKFSNPRSFTQVQAIRAMSQLPALESLTIDRMGLEKSDQSGNLRCPGLCQLCLTECRLSVSELKTFIATMTSLRSLHIEWTGEASLEGFQYFASYLESFGHLEHLSLRGGRRTAYFSDLPTTFKLNDATSLNKLRMLKIDYELLFNWYWPPPEGEEKAIHDQHVKLSSSLMCLWLFDAAFQIGEGEAFAKALGSFLAGDSARHMSIVRIEYRDQKNTFPPILGEPQYWTYEDLVRQYFKNAVALTAATPTNWMLSLWDKSEAGWSTGTRILLLRDDDQLRSRETAERAEGFVKMTLVERNSVYAGKSRVTRGAASSDITANGISGG